MYCGSCLHDNALAKALIAAGHDALLMPTYTPILTDEPSVAGQQLFYGGLNVYLQQIFAPARWLPQWADRFLNSTKLVGWIASGPWARQPTSSAALPSRCCKAKMAINAKRSIDW